MVSVLWSVYLPQTWESVSILLWFGLILVGSNQAIVYRVAQDERKEGNEWPSRHDFQDTSLKRIRPSNQRVTVMTTVINI